jgi:methylenetetrahydrofolate dehydrogenase (NADP+)/methenyltetrahydrofolate cyclohydrolase
MKLLDGKTLSDALLQTAKTRVQSLISQGVVPGLAVVLVGDDPASQSYVNSKEKTCKDLGMHSLKIELPKETTQEKLLSVIDQLNKDKAIHGILVQSPVPKHIDENTIVESILPEKDVDGFHPINVGNLALERECFVPCTPLGVTKLLEHYKIEVEGKHAVIIGRSHLVGKPMAMLFMQKAKHGNATVTVCHSRSRNLKEICRQADILVAAIGKPRFVTAEFVKPGAVVVDVGINRIPDPASPKGSRLVGDVDFDGVKETASWITPVPGGVGKMTIAMLMENVLLAAERSARR